MAIADIVAIDVLLEPDARMLSHAESNNARLRSAFPDSFALDAERRPHITLLQCFVAAGDLEALNAAVGAVIRTANVSSMALYADRYGYTPGPGMGVAGIWVAMTPELLKLQADVIAALRRSYWKLPASRRFRPAMATRRLMRRWSLMCRDLLQRLQVRISTRMSARAPRQPPIWTPWLPSLSTPLPLRPQALLFISLGPTARPPGC